jgi:hypothetical protein
MPPLPDEEKKVNRQSARVRENFFHVLTYLVFITYVWVHIFKKESFFFFVHKRWEWEKLNLQITRFLRLLSSDLHLLISLHWYISELFRCSDYPLYLHFSLINVINVLNLEWTKQRMFFAIWGCFLGFWFFLVVWSFELRAARKVLYYLSHPSSPFLFWAFSR